MPLLAQTGGPKGEARRSEPWGSYSPSGLILILSPARGRNFLRQRHVDCGVYLRRVGVSVAQDITWTASSPNCFEPTSPRCAAAGCVPGRHVGLAACPGDGPVVALGGVASRRACGVASRPVAAHIAAGGSGTMASSGSVAVPRSRAASAFGRGEQIRLRVELQIAAARPPAPSGRCRLPRSLAPPVVLVRLRL